MKSVALCASVSFYRHAIEISEQLEELGFKVILPSGAQHMRETGDFSVESSKTWYENPDDFYKKAEYMREHFENIEKSDLILILNDEKHGVAGYVGPNVIMEAGVAFYLHKPVYILNEVFNDMPTYEEVMGVLPVVLKGDLKGMKAAL